MNVVMTGMHGGIGSALARRITEVFTPSYTSLFRLTRDGWMPQEADAVICCAGTNDPRSAIDVNLAWTIEVFSRIRAPVYVAFSGARIGGPPALDMSAEYVASKAGVVAFVEYFAAKHPDRRVFAVAPGLVSTPLAPREGGASPDVVADFVLRLLTEDHSRLSGSLIARRDDLDTMEPQFLRRTPH